MLRPVIMVGCGGSGQKAIRYVRDAVSRHLRHAGWDEGFPRAWRFLGIDTLTTQEAPGEIPTMPESDYLSVSLNYTIYSHAEDDLRANCPPDSDRYRELIGWRPAPTEVKVPLIDGAGQMRAVGRVAGLRSIVSVVRPKLHEAFTACRDGGPELQRVSEVLGIDVPPGSEVPDPMVVVVGSMAGGTGAGIMLDVIDLIRSTDTRGAFPISIIFSSDIFGLGDKISMSANGLAFMSELMAAYWSQDQNNTNLVDPLVRVDSSGPHAVFMIGRTNTRGLDLHDSIYVYRAVGEALATWVTSNHVQEEVINFVTVNWQSAAKENMGGYPFGEGLTSGVISSFGAATLAIGRDRFFDYAVKLITREMVRHLYEGHQQHTNELGPQTDEYSEIRIISELVKLNTQNFIQACGLDERNSRGKQVSDIFASRALVEQEASKIRNEIQQKLRNEQLEATDWKVRIESQARIAKNNSQERSPQAFRQHCDEWASDIFQQILWVVSGYLAKYGINVTYGLVSATCGKINEAIIETNNESSQDERRAEELLRRVSEELGHSNVGKFGLESDIVTKAIRYTTDSIALEWRADQRRQVANLMEALLREILNPIASRLQIGIERLNVILHGDSHLMSAIDIDDWPRLGSGVPDSFLPSSLELFIEDPIDWPDILDELLKEVTEDLARGDRIYGPRNNIDAARYLLVSGASLDSQESNVLPIIWTKSRDKQNPKWWPGTPPQVELELSNDLNETIKRVEDWLNRPNSRSQRFFGEGLRDYLSEVDAGGKLITDHIDRLTRFKQRLSEAKDKSQPLMEIDVALSKTVHHSDKPEQIIPLTQQFPFPVGHPAREVVSEIFKDHPSVEFANHNRESVLISSFVESPLHPMVIPSFTRSLTVALDEVGEKSEYMQSSFWLFRRARTLNSFVPVPSEVMKSFMRGFAVARLIGGITVDPRYPVLIAPLPSHGGIDNGVPIEFPFPLLTHVDPENILPALLEAFSCCFGRVATRRHNAFEAYEQLHRYGAKFNQRFMLPEPILTYLHTGSLPIKPVDRSIVKRLSGVDEEQRYKNFLNYLDKNLARLRELSRRPFTGGEYRSGIGSILPDSEVMTIEICSPLIETYEEVRESLITRHDSTVV